MSERTNAEYASGLRAIADWYEAHPEAPQPHTSFEVFTAHTKQEAINIARWFGHADKRYESGLLYLSRDFGGVRLTFVFSQEAVCTRRVVGVKHVPAVFIAEHDREIVEWDCHPLLEPEVE